MAARPISIPSTLSASQRAVLKRTKERLIALNKKRHEIVLNFMTRQEERRVSTLKKRLRSL